MRHNHNLPVQLYHRWLEKPDQQPHDSLAWLSARYASPGTWAADGCSLDANSGCLADLAETLWPHKRQIKGFGPFCGVSCCDAWMTCGRTSSVKPASCGKSWAPESTHAWILSKSFRLKLVSSHAQLAHCRMHACVVSLIYKICLQSTQALLWPRHVEVGGSTGPICHLRCTCAWSWVLGMYGTHPYQLAATQRCPTVDFGLEGKLVRLWCWSLQWCRVPPCSLHALCSMNEHPYGRGDPHHMRHAWLPCNHSKSRCNVLHQPKCCLDRLPA